MLVRLKTGPGAFLQFTCVLVTFQYFCSHAKGLEIRREEGNNYHHVLNNNHIVYVCTVTILFLDFKPIKLFDLI